MVRVLCVALGYLFGLFQTSYLIGKTHGIDIRDYGSGNAGTTNMLRTMGKKAGALTFVGDFLKCVAMLMVVEYLIGPKYPDMVPLLKLYGAAGVILGHNFPFYLNFRGGKGIAASSGLVFLHPVIAVLGIITFFLTFFLTHYVSLGSLMIYVGFVIEVIIMGQLGMFGMTQVLLIEMDILACLLAAMAFYRHKGNIKRLLNGTERKTYLINKKK